MNEITVISGKGGTGKSSITRALLDCAPQCSVSDCDVDAANLHLVLEHRVIDRAPFVSGYDYEIDPARCTSCKLCDHQCAYNAIAHDTIDPYLCEGCGVCHYFCPADAVQKTDKECGELFQTETSYGPFVYARLHAGEENSGKLVARVREISKQTAEEKNRLYCINDGPPGIGCPVIASMTGAQAVLIVTEPTISGFEDYLRVSELAAHFGMQVFVCVNKADINPEITHTFAAHCEKDGACFAGTVDYDHSFREAQIKRTSVMETGSEKIRTQIMSVWKQIESGLQDRSR